MPQVVWQGVHDGTGQFDKNTVTYACYRIQWVLGSRKTTLLNRILANREGMRMAVVVNDMSEVNSDATLMRDGGGNLSRTEGKLVEMTNGCIWCTLREDLLFEVARLARANKFDYLLFESTGISEPMPVAETFTFEDEEGKSLSQIANLDTMVTVIDDDTNRKRPRMRLN